MEINPLSDADPSAEILDLVRRLHETQQRLRELTGGEVDAVVHPEGQSYLLQEAQEKLRLSETAQRDSANTMLGILNALPAHIALLDSHGVILSVNNIWKKFATENGLQGPNYNVGQNYVEICERATGTYSEDAHLAAAGIRTILNGESRAFAFEYPCHSSTENRWYELRVTPVQDGGAVVMHINVTERKIDDELKRQSEERFHSMFDATATGIAISTPDGQYLQANAAYCRMLGYTEDELRKLNFATITHPEDIPRNLDTRDDLLAGRRESFVMEKRYLRKDGSILWVRASVSATHGPGGELATLVVMSEDITERVLAEAAMRESDQQYRWKTAFFEAQVNSALDGILIVDSRGKKILQNQRMIDLWEIPASIATDVEDAPQLAWVAGQVKNSRDFVERATHLQAHPDEVSRDEIDLINGKCFDRYSAPVKSREGMYYGRIWTFRNITERKRTEARFRRLVDSNVQSVLFWDKSGKITGANDAFLDLVHHTRKELEAGDIDWMAMTPPEYAQLDLRALDEIAARGSCEPYEKEYLLRDGARVPILLGAAAFEDNPNEGVAFILDLTERRRAEMETRLNEQRYRVLVEATTAIVWDTPASGEFTAEQPAWTTFTGQSFEELRGWGWLNAIHPEDRAETGRVWSKAVADRTIYEVEHRLQARDLVYHDMMVRAVPILAENGTIKQWIGIHTDITERKKSEERILEQAALLEKTRDAIMVRDLDGKVLYWNRGAEQMYGWTESEVMGRKTGDFLYAHPEKFKEINDFAIDQGEWNGEVQHLNTTGDQITVEARWTLIRDKEGRPKSILAINTNITERKKIEHQFLRAQRMESIGTLAGGIAHDLNNILAPILMSIQLLKLTASDEEAIAILGTIETNAKRGADVVRQVLSFARGVEGQRIEVQPKYLLKEIENIIKETFPKNIKLEFLIPEEIWTIEGDPTQIHQILLNLCVNGRDAMINGGRLSISVENCVLDEHYSAMNLTAKAGPYVMINVTDSGTGMPQGVIDKIFEPFFTTKDLSAGTGLGLSTVMAIVKSHQGVINVYSESGKGTTFKVYLPAIGVSSEMPGPPVKKSILPRGEGKTVLVIEDEASILTITKKTLCAFGYKVLTASDGADGIAVYAQRQKEISIVVTDMTMPIMNGIATIRALLRINPTLKIVATSGLNAKGDGEKLSEMGVKHTLVKPYTAETLLTVLDRALAAGSMPEVSRLQVRKPGNEPK